MFFQLMQLTPQTHWSRPAELFFSSEGEAPAERLVVVRHIHGQLVVYNPVLSSGPAMEGCSLAWPR